MFKLGLMINGHFEGLVPNEKFMCSNFVDKKSFIKQQKKNMS